MRQNGSNLNGRSGARPTARRDLGQLPSGQRKRHRKPGAMYLNHSRGFSDRSARIGNSRTPRRSSRLPYALIAVGCALVLFIAAVVGYVNRSVDVELNGQKTAVRVGSTLQNLIDEQDLTDTYDAGDLLAVDDSVLKRHGGEKLSVKVDGKRVKQGKWDSRELEGGEKVTVKDGRNTYEKHEVQATVIEPKLKVEGTGAIEYVQTWGVQGRSEVWVGEQSGKTQDRGEVVPATDCVVACASVAPKGNKKYVALTFDEGPSGATKQILQVLKEKGVAATFFLSGDSVEGNPATAKAIVDAGCEIGSNSYSDDSLKGQDREAVREQKHEVQATVIEPKLKVEGTGAIEYVQTWGVQGRSEVWVGEQSGKTQDRGEVVPATDCVVACASVAPKGNKKYVALTFDEGPSGATKQILQVLKEKGVAATFFLSGDSVEGNPATAKAIVDAGCEIGSNSYSDDSLKGQDREAVREQITKGTDAIKSATGVKTMLLRAPYAAFDEQNWIDAMDLVSAVVSWNIDSGDWLLNGADEQVSTVLDSVTPGNIVLLTDRDECAEQTLEALPRIIDGLIADGYKIVTLSDLVKTDMSLSKKLTSLTKVTMPKGAVFPQLAEDNDATE